MSSNSPVVAGPSRNPGFTHFQGLFRMPSRKRARKEYHQHKTLPPLPCHGLIKENKEILKHIVSYFDPITDKSTLRSLQLTSSTFKSIAQVNMYSTLGYGFTTVEQYALLLRTLQENPKLIGHAKRLNISNVIASILDYTVLNTLADLLPKFKNLKDLVFTPGSQVFPAAFIFQNCNELNLKVLEWESCIADEDALAQFLRSQEVLRKLDITWSGTRLMKDAAPVLQALTGGTDAVMAIVPDRPVGQLNWTGVGYESDEELQMAARYLTCIREMTLQIHPLSKFALISNCLPSLNILELIITDADVERLNKSLHPLKIHTLILSTQPFSVECMEIWERMYNIVKLIFQDNSSLEELYIQKEYVQVYSGNVDRPHERGPEYYDFYARKSDWTNPKIVSENMVFGWKDGFEMYPFGELGKLYI